MTALSRRQFTNNGTSTLASSLATGALSLQVASGHGSRFPQPSDLTDGHFYATLEDSSGNIEIVKVTARSSDTMTIERQQEGTTSPSSFPDTTTRVELRVTANLVAEWLLPSYVRYLAGGLGITFEGPSYPTTATNIATILGKEDPLRVGKLILDIAGSADADVRIHADGRKVMIQDVYYPDGAGVIGQTLQLTATNEFAFADMEIQILDSSDVSLTKRPKLKFGTGLTATDDAANDRTIVNAVTQQDLTGTVYDWAGSSAPSWGLFCDGAAVSRTTYAALFAVIGTTYGAGDGSTTFNVPDLRGRVVAGRDDMGGASASRMTTGSKAAIDGTSLGAAGGAEEITLVEAEIPAHTHSAESGATQTNNAEGGSGDYINNMTATTTGSTGGGAAHANVQPTMVLNKVIRHAA